MDDRRFDALTRSLAAGASRRRVMKGMLGGLAGFAVFGGKRAYAEDEATPEPESDTTTDPVVDDAPPAEEAPPPAADETAPPEGAAPPEGTPPADEGTPTDPPADPPADPPVDPPADTPTDTGVEPVDEGTPADPASQPAPVCGEGWTVCETLCCEPGWRCCGVYCIPDREDSCCADTECGECEICSLDGVCYPICDAVDLECCVNKETNTFYCAHCCEDDPNCGVVIDCDFCESLGQQCCHDDKHNTTYCAYCCDQSDCAEWGACHHCYGGYCLTCYDQTDGRAPICAIDECGESVAGAGGGGNYCVECCSDEQCGACQRCHNGWCEYVCDEGEHCCEADLSAAGLINGGYCASCCSSDDCGGCERCDHGVCGYACGRGQTCCHDEYCAPYSDGCCGVSGDWCDAVSAAGGDHLNGSCCDGLHCCTDKHGGSTCSECCDDWDCPEGGRCCGGTCSAECCSDHDCKWGHCVGGYCEQCRDNNDCHGGKICCDGECSPYECCYENDLDPVNCSECEICTEGYCRPTGVSLYGACNPMIVTAGWGDTPQLNCCDGLVCCDTRKYGLVCVECCGDHDCAHGCTCDEGFCSCGCSSDHDCGDGTCCCKNGSCSEDCCPKPPHHPHHPHKPSTPATGGTTVTTLPATGSGGQKQGTSWISAAALGAAAAYLASRKLKPEETPEAPAPEE